MSLSSTTFLPGDSLKQRLKKAAHVAPSPAQLKWMRREYIAFLHYSPNTFTNRQWGTGDETPEDFCPDRQDPDQWVRVCRDAGMKMVIPTLKHHDGFCQWHTESTDFQVSACPETQDIAAVLSKACAAYGVELGVYLSPWDMHQRELGVWPGDAYQQVFLQQLRELMTQYGEIGELWLDGACGDFPIWEPVPSYRPEAWYDMMEKEQPLCVTRRYDPFCFASESEWEELKQGRGELRWRGKAVRWVGNEDGTGREDEWSVQPVFRRVLGSDATLPDLGQEHYYRDAVGAVWYPNEVNTHLLNQWFLNEETSYVRPLSTLIDIFYHSIGNNGVLLLNISPDRHGIIPEDQIRRLAEFRAFMDGTFSVNLARGSSVHADSEQEGAPALSILAEDEEHWWSPAVADWDADTDTAEIEITLPEERTFDNLQLREHIQEGQRVAGWRAFARADGKWIKIAEKKTVGFRTVVRFPAVTADRLRIEVFRSWDTPMLAGLGLFLTHTPETEDMNPYRHLNIPALSEAPGPTEPGLRYTLYQGGLQSAALADGKSRKLLAAGVMAQPGIPDSAPAQDYSLVIEGYLRVPFPHETLLKLGSADGAILYLNGQRIIDNDEPHDEREQTVCITLEKGIYDFRLLYTSFRHPGKLRLLMTNPAFEFEPLHPLLLSHSV